MGSNHFSDHFSEGLQRKESLASYPFPSFASSIQIPAVKKIYIYIYIFHVRRQLKSSGERRTLCMALSSSPALVTTYFNSLVFNQAIPGSFVNSFLASSSAHSKLKLDKKSSWSSRGAAVTRDQCKVPWECRGRAATPDWNSAERFLDKGCQGLVRLLQILYWITTEINMLVINLFPHSR